jgi:hypothetical protein
MVTPTPRNHIGVNHRDIQKSAAANKIGGASNVIVLGAIEKVVVLTKRKQHRSYASDPNPVRPFLTISSILAGQFGKPSDFVGVRGLNRTALAAGF